MDELVQTASPLEIVWTVLMVIGTVVAACNWWNAQGDLDALRASGINGVVMITGRGERSDQQALFLALFANTILGLLALFSLPGQDPDGGPSVAAQWSPLLLIVAGLAMIFLSLSKARRRQSLMEALRAQHDAA